MTYSENQINESQPYLNTGLEVVREYPTKTIQTRTIETDPFLLISDWVVKKLEKGQSFNKHKLFNLSDEAFNGKRSEGAYSSKDAFDAMEFGINRYILSISGSLAMDTPENVLSRINNEILNKIPSQNGLRTDEMVELQQFSTPPDLAYLIAWTANINKYDTILEPSAGTGNLVSFVKKTAGKIIVNELSPRRANILHHLGFTNLYRENAEQLHNILPPDIEPTVVLMNPPFSSTSGRMPGKRNSKFGMMHIEQALNRLKPNGRLVTVMGKGFRDSSNPSPRWLETLKAKYCVSAIININGKTFSKYGTAYNCRLIVIDKKEPANNILAHSVSHVKEAFPLLLEVRNARVKLNHHGNNEPKNNSTLLSKPDSIRSNKDDDSIYEEYTPQELNIPGAKGHPAKLVQSAAMSSVNPPKPTYNPVLQKNIIDSGKLSSAQLEAIVYAGQAHQKKLPNGQTKGFFIGDGTGVGKGREISGIIMDNFNQGREKALWISLSAKLINDAIRDWTDIGGDKSMFLNLSQFKLGHDISHNKGILFTTYATLRSQKKKNRRLDQIIKWLGEDFNGVIVFDESHAMSNSCDQKGVRGNKKASQTGLAGVELQKRLPNAKVVYASATGASKVEYLVYANRLGLWGENASFADRKAFIENINDGGIAAMEVVARDMKAQGVYIARSLDFSEVKYSRLEHKLSHEQEDIYNELARAWQIVLQNVDDALELTDAKLNGMAKGAALAKFWGAHQRFFNQVITSMQMPSVTNDIKKELDKDHSIVLQLVNTNEAIQDRQIAKLDDIADIEELDMTPRENLMQYIENCFPTQQYEMYIDDDGNTRSRPVYDSTGNPVINAEATRLKEELLDRLGSIKVPEGPLEIILNTFGVENVAEVTGRRRRVVLKKDNYSGNTIKVIESRSPSKGEMDSTHFMSGEKRILIFSDAGGTGRSYHADLTKKNRQRRIHYLIQAGWQAYRAIQGFGRTHRSNQASAPHYKLVTTNLNGQKRFISSIARRLNQLGALTKGQRETGNQGLFSEKDNLESQYACDALHKFFIDLHRGEIKELDFATTTKMMGLNGLSDSNGNLNTSKLPNIPRFLNRILSLEIDIQNQVFDEFSHRLEDNVKLAIASGNLDTGLENYKANSVEIEKVKIVYRHDESDSETKYIKFKTKNKVEILSFDDAKNNRGLKGFYMNKRSKHIWAVRSFTLVTKENGSVCKSYILESPLKHNYRIVEEDDFQIDSKYIYGKNAFRKKWKKVDDNFASTWWKNYIFKAPEYKYDYVHLITGILLPIWERLPKEQMRVMRIKTNEGVSYIGRIIPEDNLEATLKNLGAEIEGKKYGYKMAMELILERNTTVELANGWFIKKRVVSGEDRIEIIGDLYRYSDELLRNGAFKERINYETRFFIPTDQKGLNVLKSITQSRPIVGMKNKKSNNKISLRPTENKKPVKNNTVFVKPVINISMVDGNENVTKVSNENIADSFVKVTLINNAKAGKKAFSKEELTQSSIKELLDKKENNIIQYRLF